MRAAPSTACAISPRPFVYTDAAFNVEWKGGVVVTKGGEYAAAALPARTVDTAANSVSISVSVDGAAGRSARF